MAYEVIARKWRPQKFADVVGQSQITKTLQSELLQEKLAHAYLFVGPRGIGKTTIARIFAKAMNCERAPVDEPCCECDSCRSIAEGGCIDLIEIDGASNNSVESMRTVCDEVLYAPVRSRFKVYIIDEVHMLSASAWNALLKTIEEPPPHAKFLFATTEAHKVLPTVVSRCQRFDLRRITFKLIIDQLRKIATAEGVSVSDGALEVIARAADGGMRDAQSLLDQMIAFSSADQGEISEEQTLSVFGLTGVAEMETLLTAILRDDKPAVISSIHKIASHGKNLEKLFDDILAFLRGVHICMLMPNPESVLETGDDMIALYKKVGAVSNASTVHKMLEQLSPVGAMLHNAMNKQVFLETILLKAMRTTHAVEIADLIARLNQLRGAGELKELEKIPSVARGSATESASPSTPSADAASASGSPRSAASASADPATVAVQPAGSASSSEVAAASPSPAAPASPATASGSVEHNVQASDEASEEDWPTPPPASPRISPAVSEAASEYVAPAQQSESQNPVAQARPAPPNAAGGQQALGQAGESASPAQSTRPSTSTEPQGAPQEPILLTKPVTQSGSEQTPAAQPASSPSPAAKLESPISIWHALIEEMEKCSQPLLKAFMKEGKPKSFAKGVLTVEFDDEFNAHVEAITKNKPLLETCLKRLMGQNASLDVVRTKGVEAMRGHVVNDDAVKAEIKARAEENPFVQEVLDLFDGEIVDVRG